MGGVESVYAQAPVTVISKILSQKPGAKTLEVVLFESTPRTQSLVIREQAPTTFGKDVVSRDSTGLHHILWLLFLSPNLVVELEQRGLDNSHRVVLGNNDRLQIQYGTTPSLVVDFETNQLVRVDLEHEGQVWTLIWESPETRTPIRVLRNSAPFAMISGQ